MKNRIYALDYLRGLMALSIMVYHYTGWSGHSYTAHDTIKRISIYGVSIFYILSGLTLYLVYFPKMVADWKGLKDFYLKRLLRIFPLFWLVTITTIIIQGRLPDYLSLLLNLTGAFSLFSWSDYIATGAWSIGNELAFYLMFPVLLLLGRTSRPVLLLFSVMTFAAYLYFAFFALNNRIALGQQWHIYVNPLNQAFLFIVGFLLGYFTEKHFYSNFLIIFITGIALLLFVFIPTSEDTIILVTRYRRILFTLISVTICFSIYKSNLPYIKPLSILGEISYGLYLLHPIVYLLCQKVSLSIWFALPASFAASYLSYQYFEKPIMKLGRREYKSS